MHTSLLTLLWVRLKDYRPTGLLEGLLELGLRQILEYLSIYLLQGKSNSRAVVLPFNVLRKTTLLCCSTFAPSPAVKVVLSLNNKANHQGLMIG